MGTAASKVPKTRRFSRMTNFTHWMDNISDKKLIKIKMTRKPSEGFDGVFILWYQDDAADDFMNIKSTFTFSGKYTPGTEAGSIKFVTNELNCKLTEDGHSFTWRITPADKPDCIINESTGVISWPWDTYGVADNRSASSATIPASGSPPSGELVGVANSTTSTDKLTPRRSSIFRGFSKVIEHTAPLGSLDFVGEDNPETGGFVLRLRIPQLAAGWNPAVVALNPMGGWELSKQSSFLGGSSAM
jgi:hypothetical protein